MFKLTVLYPNTVGARFNHDYYRDSHMPMVKARLGAACLSYSIDKGLLSDAGEPPFVGMCHIYANTAAEFHAAFAAHAAEIFADVPNYTDIAPTLQMSEVVVG